MKTEKPDFIDTEEFRLDYIQSQLTAYRERISGIMDGEIGASRDGLIETVREYNGWLERLFDGRDDERYKKNKLQLAFKDLDEDGNLPFFLYKGELVDTDYVPTDPL